MNEPLGPPARSCDAIAEIVDVSEAQLLRRAILDASESMARYFTAGRSTREAIDTFERLRSSFDDARREVDATRRRARERT